MTIVLSMTITIDKIPIIGLYSPRSSPSRRKRFEGLLRGKLRREAGGLGAVVLPGAASRTAPGKAAQVVSSSQVRCHLGRVRQLCVPSAMARNGFMAVAEPPHVREVEETPAISEVNKRNPPGVLRSKPKTPCAPTIFRHENRSGHFP